MKARPLDQLLKRTILSYTVSPTFFIFFGVRVLLAEMLKRRSTAAGNMECPENHGIMLDKLNTSCFG